MSLNHLTQYTFNQYSLLKLLSNMGRARTARTHVMDRTYQPSMTLGKKLVDAVINLKLSQKIHTPLVRIRKYHVYNLHSERSH